MENTKFMSVDDIPVVFHSETLCEILNISKNTAYEIIKNKDFPKKKVGNKIFIYKNNFIKWLDFTSE